TKIQRSGLNSVVMKKFLKLFHPAGTEYVFYLSGIWQDKRESHHWPGSTDWSRLSESTQPQRAGRYLQICSCGAETR
ncbi:hypothetical protein TNCT_56361, partial [Trichonephila clavata]